MLKLLDQVLRWKFDHCCFTRWRYLFFLMTVMLFLTVGFLTFDTGIICSHLFISVGVLCIPFMTLTAFFPCSLNFSVSVELFSVFFFSSFDILLVDLNKGGSKYHWYGDHKCCIVAFCLINIPEITEIFRLSLSDIWESWLKGPGTPV